MRKKPAFQLARNSIVAEPRRRASRHRPWLSPARGPGILWRCRAAATRAMILPSLLSAREEAACRDIGDKLNFLHPGGDGQGVQNILFGLLFLGERAVIDAGA